MTSYSYSTAERVEPADIIWLKQVPLKPNARTLWRATAVNATVGMLIFTEVVLGGGSKSEEQQVVHQRLKHDIFYLANAHRSSTDQHRRRELQP